jgi:3-hydroxyacyl-CoA dehydrogenase/3a,7a,12a-trihydroxy-5b-cholest-24-enoyl-CoA hydratase
VELFAELPKAASKPAQAPTPTPAQPPSPAPALSLTSADVFTGIEDHIGRHPELAAKIGKSFVFHLKSPDSSWTVDLKNAPGSVKAGAGAADCTLELADADFMAMTSGKSDPMKLYMGGQLKVSGDVMASQKLTFLQKVDPKLALEAIKRKRGGGSSPAPSETGRSAPTDPVQTAPPKTSDARAPALFKALADRLAKTPSLAREVGAVLQFDVTSPDASWVVDLTGASAVGAVREGKDAKANAVFRIADADLALLARDPSLSRDYYQRGKLRVDGDVRLAPKLGFLKDLA